MHKVGRDTGNQIIRELLPDFPDVYDNYYLVDGGIIAFRPCRFGGNELHIAFNDKSKVRSEVSRFCDIMGGTWWAIIRKERQSVINSSLKAGFIYEANFKGSSIVDNIEREYVALKRG